MKDNEQAAEELAWREKWRAEALERRAAAQPYKLGESWKPTLTPEQKAAQMQYIEANGLPF